MTPPAGIELFRCAKQNATLSTVGCARMWRKANGGEYRVQPHEALAHCRGCSIGAAHAGERVSGVSELVEALRTICPRCTRPAFRLINGKFCISCYNRDREARIGRNAKGGKPMLAALLHDVRIALTEGATVRTVQCDRITSLTEAVIHHARHATGPIVFTRAVASHERF